MAEAKTNGQTELIFLMDVSEPMADFASDIIAGFNGMIARLREEETDILVTTWQFADFCLYVDERVPITRTLYAWNRTSLSASVSCGSRLHAKLLPRPSH